MPDHRCDIYHVARQCGVILREAHDHSPTSRRPRECFCKPAVRRIGQAYGEAHLALCFRLIVESEGNAGELYAETLAAVSIALTSGLIEPDSGLFEAFDGIDLGALRRWAHAARGTATTPETMATALLWRLAGPDMILPKEPPTAGARRERNATLKAERERKRRRLKAA